MRRPLLLGASVVLVSLTAAAVVLAYIAAAEDPRQSATAADPALGGGPGCAPTRTEQLVRGNGTGSVTSGPDVILAFQYAYYVTRSGAAARALTTARASVSSQAVIEAGIASVPAGTRHCVLITALSVDRFDVVVTEMRPGTTARTYRQFVTVTAGPEGVEITAIGPPI
jgi:hypothetical protein